MLYRGSEDTQDEYFDKPYTRSTPFAIGIALGILFVDFKWMEKAVRPRAGWMLMVGSLALMACIVYVDCASFHAVTAEWTPALRASYQAFGRLAFSLAVASVTLLCV